MRILLTGAAGVSDNVRGWWDNRRAHELGYAPKHASENFAYRVLARTEASDAIADQ